MCHPVCHAAVWGPGAEAGHLPGNHQQAGGKGVSYDFMFMIIATYLVVHSTKHLNLEKSSNNIFLDS